MEDFQTWFSSQQDPMTSLLRELVEIESPSEDKAAVDRLGARVQALMQQAGAVVQKFPSPTAGETILGTWGGALPGPAFTFLCHMDTVWPLGTLNTRPLRIEEGRLYGPGAYDMKAGIVIALTAVRGMQALGCLPPHPVHILCTADEEIGSHASRDIILRLAHASQFILVMEQALPGGVMKTARKGVGDYKIRVEGRAAHAGGDHRQGVNAIEEMAYHIPVLQRLTNYELGTTVNVGVIQGGSASNVVPAECIIEVDFRISTNEEAQRLEEAIRSLKPVLPGARLSISGELNRPPMVRDARMMAAFEKASAIAARHGIALLEGSSGGGSDGNFTSAITSTLDGLGADGDGAHAVHEHVLLSSLPQRAALAAALVSKW